MSEDRKDLPVTPEQAYEEGAPVGRETGSAKTGGGAGGPGGAGSPTGPSFEADEGPHPAVDEVPSWRLITTLAVAGALAGLLIVGVFQWAQPQILEYRATVLTTAIGDVLGGPERVQTLYVEGGGLVEQPPVGTDTITAEKVYIGYDETGASMGFAILGAEPGFQDVIQVIFGYDPGRDEVLGMQVLESKETPGLGDAIMKDQSFIAEFEGVATPLEGVKEPTGAPNEIDMITGATISSEAIVDIINHRLEDLDGVLSGYEGGGP